MVETPCEVKRRKGASPMDGARVTLRTDAELECPPGDAKRAVGVSHAESWRRNIYASKLAHYTFLRSKLNTNIYKSALSYK